MIYEVFSYDDALRCKLGTYANEALAQQVCDKVNALGGIVVYIAPIEVLAEMPKIFTHSAHISFEDINDVKVFCMDAPQIVDSYNQPFMNKPCLRPFVGVGSVGTSASEAITNVKFKLVKAIQDGTYECWKESIGLKALALKTALSMALLQDIEMSEDNYPINTQDFATWNDILNSCYKDLELI